MKLNPPCDKRVHPQPGRGFTLVEMLLVLVILSVLAAIVYPNMAHHSLESRIKATRVQIQAFRSALAMFELDNGHYPNGRNGLLDLVRRPNDAPNWRHPYLDKIPPDPWGHAYLYECPGTHLPDSYDLASMGPDGLPGNEDDIANWQ